MNGTIPFVSSDNLTVVSPSATLNFITLLLSPSILASVSLLHSSINVYFPSLLIVTAFTLFEKINRHIPAKIIVKNIKLFFNFHFFLSYYFLNFFLFVLTIANVIIPNIAIENITKYTITLSPVLGFAIVFSF